MTKIIQKRLGLYLGISLFLFFITNTSFLHSQNAEKLTGILRIKQGESYPFEINFKIDTLTGKLTGYSVFNPGKSNETKSLLQGKYTKDKLEFKEYKVIASKSTDPNSKMCYIHYKGESKKVLNAQMMVGDFKGYFNDGKQCGEGTINLLAREKYFRRIDSARTEKAKEKNKDTSFTSMAKFFKGVPIQKTDNSSTNIYWYSDTLHFRVWDPDKVDNDQISISLNGKLIKPVLKLSENEFIYKEYIEKSTTVVLRAINVGFLPPNTSKIIFLDRKDDYFFLNNLGENTTSTFQIIKK